MQELEDANHADKVIVARKLLEYASTIAENRRCGMGEIIWLRTEPFTMEHNKAVLAALRTIGVETHENSDWHGYTTASMLTAMTMISTAKTIAPTKELRLQSLLLGHVVGSLFDDLMRDAQEDAPEPC